MDAQLKTTFSEGKIHSIDHKNLKEAGVDNRIREKKCVVKNVVKNIQKTERHAFVSFQIKKEKEIYQLEGVKFAVVKAAMIKSIQITLQVDQEADQDNHQV